VLCEALFGREMRIVEAMKSITATISGLASSLFLNAGFCRIAEKLDPIASLRSTAAVSGPTVLTAANTCYPCFFSPKPKN